MDDRACKSHWYDKLYDSCRYSNGRSVPEAFYGPGTAVVDGCVLQHKTFSFVDHRSGRTVRLYGIVDRYSFGADADFLVNQIVSDILPFDRTTDHILNNDPSDREIYCLLDEVLRKIYRVDLNSSNTSTNSGRGGSGSDSRSPFSSPEAKKNENNSTPQPKHKTSSPSNARLPSEAVTPYAPPVISQEVAEKLRVMQFINFYKDIIERVDEAAEEDERKYREMVEMNQEQYYPVMSYPYDESMIALPEQPYSFDGGIPSSMVQSYPYDGGTVGQPYPPNGNMLPPTGQCYPLEGSMPPTVGQPYPFDGNMPCQFGQPYPFDGEMSVPAGQSYPFNVSMPPSPEQQFPVNASMMPSPAQPYYGGISSPMMQSYPFEVLPSPMEQTNPFNGNISSSPEQFFYPMDSPTVATTPSRDNYTRKTPTYSPRKRSGMLGRKLIARSTSLPTISESAEKWWNEEGEFMMNPDELKQLENLPDNAVVPQLVPKTFQKTVHSFSVESDRMDDEFLKEVQKITGRMDQPEASEKESEDKSDDSRGASDNSVTADSFLSYTAAAIVFIYGNKMFVGSIGDSRVILMRQKYHYMDVMYLNEPPLAWCPVASADTSYFRARRYDMLFQEPIVRGGFLVNESSFFLLLLNDGVVTNMQNIFEHYKTSNELNRTAAHMLVRLIEKHPSGDIAKKFLAAIIHKCNRKYTPSEITTARRDGMSVLFADLRQLIPRQPVYDHLLKKYGPGLVINDEERKKQYMLSMDRIYDMLQEIFEREASKRRAIEEALNEGFLNDTENTENPMVSNGFRNNGNPESPSRE